ncbi:MAG: amidohydrolase family protein [Candidatus Thermoplasmatota archaeon]|nr:amidohydrolase family protein [Euryarchaeota archaeon]MBU4032692.1 amidohydrolase family protein [Candidatus Thermoplasmatota archaeon]MBU4071675.1 amidohydrolase family protein [Candidatus Thermoplasmatota archaeon]MBU4145307.1 amidohydrolase family protein [Candidatus Thermoplasmatota archaeon]MBU4591066.1 amidohydrolase family protein [Candidatus Thermoplasmatota archaeon]
MDCGSLALKGGWVATQNADREILKADVLIENGRITQIGEVGSADEVIDVSGCAVIPGLINAHTHVSMTLMRGIADDVNLEKFLEKTFKVDAMRTPDDIRLGAELGSLEMLRSGCTSFVDMYYGQNEIAKAVTDIGIRGFLGWVVLDEQFTTQKGSPLANCENFIDSHKGLERIHPLVALQGVYVCSEDTLLKAKDLAYRKDTLLHIHLSETRKEVYGHQASTGKRPADWLHDIGFLCDKLLAAHCAWLTMDEMRKMAETGVSAAHCPVSNMKLASGFEAPIPEMQALGIPVGLGTDGCSSQNRLDMWGEMKTCALLHKAQRLDASVMSAQRVFDMATIEGARALGMDRELGSIETGKMADLAVIDMKHPAMVPTFQNNLISNLVYSCQSDCVLHTVVNGRIVMKNRNIVTLDEGNIITRAQNMSEKFFL